MRSEHGILFKPEMVLGILAGRKTVTRRASSRWERVQVGDLLWGRETWRPEPYSVHASYDYPHLMCRYRADNARVDRIPDCRAAEVLERRGWAHESGAWSSVRAKTGWVPSLLMPRWASRLELRVRSVLVVPADLSDVDDAEAQREGVASREEYLRLWREISGDAVPEHVWRIEYAIERVWGAS